MFRNLHLRSFTSVSLCTLLLGCGAVEEVVTPASAAKPAIVKKPQGKTQPPASQADKKSSSSKTEKAIDEQTVETTYEPPYPDRQNLFLAPKRSSSHKDSQGKINQSVELLGFANVQGPRVILSINGNVVPLAEGAKELGIEVISIQPPAVVLQRDRERWQATLEN